MRDFKKTVEDLRIHEKLFNERDAVNVATLYRDAADAIEELLAKIDELWTQLHVEGRSLIDDYPRWISVEERLPEGNGTRYEYDLEESNLVLVYGINHIGEMAYGLGRYIYDHDDPKDSGWNGNMDCDYDLDYCTVTHWMPLPAPPKEEA